MVKSGGATTPELDFPGHKPKSDPVIGARRSAIWKALAQLTRRTEQYGSAGKGGALRGYACADGAFDRTARPVGVNLGFGHSFDDSFHSHLSAGLIPVKGERRRSILRDVTPLLATAIGVKDEAPLISPLEQHEPHHNPAVGARSG
ncbi:MAG TPA: hypothetical protein VNF29_14430 [Candidatus Binataceae bacterium]|nr:hypothetical protein [Candidatus Binataceae bacterium]